MCTLRLPIVLRQLRAPHVVVYSLLLKGLSELSYFLSLPPTALGRIVVALR